MIVRFGIYITTGTRLICTSHRGKALDFPLKIAETMPEMRKNMRQDSVSRMLREYTELRNVYIVSVRKFRISPIYAI